MKKIVYTTAILLLAGVAFGQEQNSADFAPITFKTQAEKETWISSNPEAYAARVEYANQISATYIGTLLQVESNNTVKAVNEKPLSEIELLEQEIEDNRNNPEYDLELKKAKLQQAKEFESKK